MQNFIDSLAALGLATDFDARLLKVRRDGVHVARASNLREARKELKSGSAALFCSLAAARSDMRTLIKSAARTSGMFVTWTTSGTFILVVERKDVDIKPRNARKILQDSGAAPGD